MRFSPRPGPPWRSSRSVRRTRSGILRRARSPGSQRTESRPSARTSREAWTQPSTGTRSASEPAGSGRRRPRRPPPPTGPVPRATRRCRGLPGSVSPSRMIGPMSIPGRVDAAALVLSLEPPAWHIRHVRAVAEVAGWLAFRAVAAGHSVDQALPADDPVRALRHGMGGAAWLAARGYGELADAVANHPVTRLGAPDADAWLDGASAEELLVAYADKRAGQRLVPMAGRFAEWTRRYPEGAEWHGWTGVEAATVRRRAARLESAACALAGVTPTAVRRLAWTGRALVAAERARAAARAPG